MTRARPPFKWAGGKYSLLPFLRSHLPKGNRLVEPFVGSGAVFLNMPGYAEYVLADANRDLIDFYAQLRADPEPLVQAARLLFVPANNNVDEYLALREEFNQAPYGELRRLALFLYLNRHGFNGMCRYNKSGKFNIPFGRYKAPSLSEAELRQMAAALRTRNVTLKTADFRLVMAEVKRGDVVYLDPPYTPASPTASFSSYHSDGFGPAEHIALAALAKSCSELGATVLISNHNTVSAKQLYAGARLETVMAPRVIAAKGSSRKAVPEILAVYEPAAPGELLLAAA